MKQAKKTQKYESNKSETGKLNESKKERKKQAKIISKNLKTEV